MAPISKEQRHSKGSKKPSADDSKKTLKKKKLPKVLKECFECVDAGSIVLVASYLDVPPESELAKGGKTKGKKSTTKNGQRRAQIGSETHEVGCIPWRLSVVHLLRKDDSGGYSKHVLKLTLRSDYRTDIAWYAKVSGTLTMKKWMDKLPAGTNPRKLDELCEHFSTKFTQSGQLHAFSTEFPLPICGGPFSGSDAISDDAAYLLNRQFKFELKFLLHDVDIRIYLMSGVQIGAQVSDAGAAFLDQEAEIHLPLIDFHKNQPTHGRGDALINVGKQKFYVNKEYLSLHSPFFSTMFSAEGFVESREQQATLEDVSSFAFNAFLQLIYDPLLQPEGDYRFFNNLLELGRRFAIQTITNRCEQRLLFMSNNDNDASTTVTVEQRMKLAEEYELVWLKAKLMVTNAVDDLLKIDGISDKTRQMLLRKKNVTVEEAEEAQRKKAEEEKIAADEKQGTSAATGSASRGGTNSRGGRGARGGVSHPAAGGNNAGAALFRGVRGGGRGRAGGRGRGVGRGFGPELHAAALALFNLNHDFNFDALDNIDIDDF